MYGVKSRTVGLMIREEIKALVRDKNFATISTLLPSGQIQTHVVWVDCDEEHIVINTEVGLRKFKNVQADPRVTVTIWDRRNPIRIASPKCAVESFRPCTALRHGRTSTRLPGSTSMPITPMS